MFINSRINGDIFTQQKLCSNTLNKLQRHARVGMNITYITLRKRVQILLFHMYYAQKRIF